METSIETFIGFGEIGGIRCGASLADILSTLGKPSDISLGKFPKIFRFGAIGITIFESMVIAINIDVDRNNFPNSRINDQATFVGMDYDSASKWLDVRLIKHENYSALAYANKNAIKILQSRVCMYFEDNALTAVGLVCA